MSCKTLLADPAAITLEKIVSAADALTLVVSTTAARAACPRCSTPSARVHSRYLRTVTDLPWQGVAVRLELHARRFRCDNGLCIQRVFCERLPSVVARYARRTNRLADALTLIGFALGGRPGSRLARGLAMAASRHTLLRAIRRALPIEHATPVALGFDDWAKRRGRDYGTTLVDLVRRRAIDLLPDRTSETPSAWLKATSAGGGREPRPRQRLRRGGHFRAAAGRAGGRPLAPDEERCGVARTHTPAAGAP